MKNKKSYRVAVALAIILFLKKVKKIFLKNVKKVSITNVILLSLLSFIAIKMQYPTVENDILEKRKHFSAVKQLEKAKIAHSYYTKALSKEELLVKWIEMYSRVKYKMNGDIKYKRADCTTAVFLFLKEYGYCGDILNVTALNQKIITLARAGLTKIRKNYKSVSLGDLILFRPNKNGIPHIGIVYEKRNGYVCYVDVNAATGMGFNRVKYGAWRVNKIVEISFTLWSGDLLQTFDPVAPAVEIKKVKEEIQAVNE